MALASPVGSWDDYQKCPVCGAGIGHACLVRSGRVVGGRPDGATVESQRPHISRRRRAGR